MIAVRAAPAGGGRLGRAPLSCRGGRREGAPRIPARCPRQRAVSSWREWCARTPPVRTEQQRCLVGERSKGSLTALRPAQGSARRLPTISGGIVARCNRERVEMMESIHAFRRTSSQRRPFAGGRCPHTLAGALRPDSRQEPGRWPPAPLRQRIASRPQRRWRMPITMLAGRDRTSYVLGAALVTAGFLPSLVDSTGHARQASELWEHSLWGPGSGRAAPEYLRRGRLHYTDLRQSHCGGARFESQAPHPV